MATAKIYATHNGIVREATPNVVENTFSLAELVQLPSGSSDNYIYGSEMLCASFEDISVVNHKKITKVEINAYYDVVYSYNDVVCGGLMEKPDYEVLTFNTVPQKNQTYTYLSYDDEEKVFIWGSASFTGYSSLKTILENGIWLSPRASSYTATAKIYGANSQSYPLYLMVTYEDPTADIADVSPKSGYVPKHNPSTFSWEIIGEGYVLNGVAQDSGTLQWRAGTSGTINSINVGTSQQYTVPGGTFTSDTIQWRISVVAAGATLTSDWYTLSTIEPTSTAEPLAPIGGFVDSTKPIAFSWNHAIETGTDQTAFDLQYSADGIQFTTVASETTANEYIAIPAGTFAPGPLYWRVRTYNTDGAAGAWSTVMQTTAIGAPEPPVVTLDDTSPRPSVRWQASGQQGYEVQVDGVTVAKAFGVSKTYRSENYLADGQHSISVRVQSQYGLWSERGTVSIQISNVAGSAITLTATGGNQAALTWTTEGAYDKYYVYRDGELIAKTTATSYDDALTNDAHIYQVRGAYDSSGDYGLSNAVNVVVRPETTILVTVDGSISVELPYSETNKRQTTMSTQRQMATMYFAGSPLPSMEIAEWTDRSMTITAALKAGENTKQLMDLVGKIVCARDQYGNCVIGPLPGWSVRSFEMYTALQTTIQDVNWREAIKHDTIA